MSTHLPHAWATRLLGCTVQALLWLAPTWAVAAEVGSAEERLRVLAEAESAYPLAAEAAAILDRSYSELARLASTRLDLAAKAKLSPEDEAVSASLRDSLGAKPGAVDTLPEYRYDPALITVAAGLESRAYDRGAKELWETMALPPPAGHEKNIYYTKAVPAHVRIGSPGAKRLFVIFNSSYSTWERGSWTNKTIALLRAAFGDVHLVVFAGFLSPEFLGLQPTLPTLGSDLPARDLYPRLRSLLDQLKLDRKIPVDTEVGLVGFSGGANLVISLLAEDSRGRRIDAPPQPVFNRGGIAFSPILDLPTSFEVLDRSNRRLTDSGFPLAQALTTPWQGNTLFEALRGYNPMGAQTYLKITQPTSALSHLEPEVRGRFYREFQIVDLATTAAAHYRDMPRRTPASAGASSLTHRAYYQEEVFPEYRKRFALAPDRSFEDYTRIEPELEAIHGQPLYLVFPQDDPVLSRSALFPEEGPSPRCLEVLQFARSLPSLRVFAPLQGAHMGYLLDNHFFLATLAALFR